MTFDPLKVRSLFPALRKGVSLDSAAGSQVPRSVVDAVASAMLEANANKGAAHEASVKITSLVDDVRSRTATFANADSPKCVVFGHNATSLTGLLAASWGRKLKPGDEVIVTGLDHQSNVDPWRRLSEVGVKVSTWEPSGEFSELDLDVLGSMVSPATKVVAMTAASNALGTMPDVAGASRVVHEAGAVLAVDAVHATPHLLPDMQAMGADSLVFSPYKVFGPHLGVLVLSPQLLADLPDHGLTFMEHGTAITWEPGTQNHEGLAGWGAAMDYLLDACPSQGSTRERLVAGYNDFESHERTLTTRMIEGLNSAGATIYGLPTADGRTSTVSFNIGQRPAREVAEHLAAKDVSVSDGHYYAYNLMMDRLGLGSHGGAVRASAVHYNTLDDIDAFIDALPRSNATLRPATHPILDA